MWNAPGGISTLPIMQLSTNSTCTCDNSVVLSLQHVRTEHWLLQTRTYSQNWYWTRRALTPEMFSCFLVCFSVVGPLHMLSSVSPVGLWTFRCGDVTQIYTASLGSGKVSHSSNILQTSLFYWRSMGHISRNAEVLLLGFLLQVHHPPLPPPGLEEGWPWFTCRNAYKIKIKAHKSHLEVERIDDECKSQLKYVYLVYLV